MLFLENVTISNWLKTTYSKIGATKSIMHKINLHICFEMRSTYKNNSETMLKLVI